MRLRSRMMKLANFDNYYFNNTVSEGSQIIQKYYSISPPPEQLTVGGGDNQGFYSISVEAPIEDVSIKEFREIVKEKLLTKLIEVKQYPFEELTNQNYENMGSLKTAFNSLYAIIMDCLYANHLEEQKKSKR